MTHQLPTARPSYALTMWVTDDFIYAEIPSTRGNPYVIKFAITEGGLTKALHLLKERYELAPSAEKNFTKAPVEAGYVCERLSGASAVYRKQNKVVQTDEERAAALNVLRKMGLV